MEIGLGKTRRKALGNGRLGSKGFYEEDPQEDAKVFVFYYISETRCVNPYL
jgi:hypothetical protein